jgi:hypothetical protein
VSTHWDATANPEDPIFTGPPRKYVVLSGASETLKVDWLKDNSTLKGERFLFVNVVYKSPLRSGERMVRASFEVIGLHGNIQYRECKHEDVDLKALQRSAVERLAGKARNAIHV